VISYTTKDLIKRLADATWKAVNAMSEIEMTDEKRRELLDSLKTLDAISCELDE